MLTIRFHARRLVPAFLLLMIGCVLILNLSALADSGERFRHHGLRDGGMRPDHEGGEAGALAALLLGIANFPVLLSLVLKFLARLMPDEMSLKERTKQLNLRQKKYLMKLHYWVNPLAIGVAIAHFWSSACRTTAMPELGMIAMLIISVLGLMMTLRLSPPSMRGIVFKLHTSPLITILILSFLLIGHSVIH